MRELSRTRADISALYQYSEDASLLLGGSAYRGAQSPVQGQGRRLMLDISYRF